MQITRTDNNSLQFDSDNVKFVFTLNKVEGGADHVIVGPAVQSDIARPGEYEYNDITIIAAEQRDKLVGMANVFKILFEKFNVGFVGSDVKKLDKQIMEFIGQVDFLLVTKESTKEAIASVVGDLEPRWISVIDTIDEEVTKQLTGLASATATNKLKVKVEEASVEEATAIGIIITSK